MSLVAPRFQAGVENEVLRIHSQSKGVWVSVGRLKLCEILVIDTLHFAPGTGSNVEATCSPNCYPAHICTYFLSTSNYSFDYIASPESMYYCLDCFVTSSKTILVRIDRFSCTVTSAFDSQGLRCIKSQVFNVTNASGIYVMILW